MATKVVNFMKQNGAIILSEHVAATDDMKISDKMFLENTGIDKSKYIEPELSQLIREADMKWIDECTHFVALLTGTAFGVGMEIERALLKTSYRS